MKMLAVMIVLAVALAPVPGAAQLPPLPSAESRYHPDFDTALDGQSAFVHLATNYTEAVAAGLLVGGLTMKYLGGTARATMIGSLCGALVAAWIYVHQAADTFVVRERR